MTEAKEPKRTEPSRPKGRDAVMQSLIDATIELVILQGLNVSAREIAARANVNHGLVHTYFGSKEELLAQAMREISSRAATEADLNGFPPPDLATRRNGELAKALARVMLDSKENLFAAHPITSAWRNALKKTQPQLTPAEIDERIIMASTMALGWALFSDHMENVMKMSKNRRTEINQKINDLVADLGGIPQKK